MLTIELSDMDEYHADINQDQLPAITVGMYRAFLARGRRGLTTLSVYQHLLFSYRLQKTDVVHATNTYLQNGLHIGERKLEGAKKLLREMGIIGKPIRKRDEKGRTIKGQVYVKLNLLPNPGPSIPAESAVMEKSPKLSIPAENHAYGFGPQTLEEVKKKDIAEKTPQPFITSLFFEQYKKRLGQAPKWTGKDAKLLKGDLARLGGDKLSAAVRLFFDGLVPSAADFADRAGWTYNIFHSQLGKIEEALARQARRLSLLKVCKACGKASETSGLDCPKCGEPDAYRIVEEKRAN